jgi:hypothetical protein
MWYDSAHRSVRATVSSAEGWLSKKVSNKDWAIAGAEGARRNDSNVDRLLAVVRANSGRSTRDTKAAVIEAVARFTGDAPQGDDMALMVWVRDGAWRGPGPLCPWRADDSGG